MSKPDKPYANSTAKPEKAMARIRAMLLKFGVKSLSWSEDIENLVIAVNFKYKDYPVSLPVDYGKLAKVYMEATPQAWNARKTRKQWEAEKLEIASRAAYSLLEDYLKGTLVMVELNAISFEEAFIGSFIDHKGRRLSSVIIPQFKEYLSGQKALGGGE